MIIWVVACLAIGVGGALVYLNQPGVKETRVENTLANATPNPSVALVAKSFSNAGHVYHLQFFSDALVTTGKLATSIHQTAVLARPGTKPTSYMVAAWPIDNSQDSQRSDCGTRVPQQVVFTVNLYGTTVSVCRGNVAPYSIYAMDVRATGTWEQVTLFNGAGADMTSNNAQLKTIFASLKFD